ncbi:MAG: anti-sigma factor family protein [Methyloligellaceae bacterium]
MSDEHTIRETALHAFVDNELDVEAGREVETWLRQHPDQKQETELWKEQKAKLKAAFDPVLDETIPYAIQETLNKSARPKKSFTIPWRNMAASILLLVTGIGTGLYMSGPKAEKSWPLFAQNAISSHLVFASDVSKPVEFAAPQQSYFLALVKERMARSLTPPALTFAGFKFLGGRIVPHEDKPAVLFMYENVNGKRITLLVGQNDTPKRKAMKLWTKNKLNCFFWFDGKLSFSVTSDIEDTKLKLVSEQVQEHFISI